MDNILKAALSIGGSSYYVWRKPATYEEDDLGSKTDTILTYAVDTKILISFQPLTSDNFDIIGAGMLNIGDALAYISNDLRNKKLKKIETDDLLCEDFNNTKKPIWRIVKVNEVPNTYTELWLVRK